MSEQEEQQIELNQVELEQKSVELAKSLAHNVKSKRTVAIRSLINWLHTREKPTELELLRLWKGLFYCMWMTDKPLIQHEVAQSLAKLPYELPTRSGVFSFLRVFYITINREWKGIDRLRTDKFYSLIRYFVFETFHYLQENNWHSDLLDDYAQMFKDALQDQTPGVLMHICDIYVEELNKTEPQNDENFTAATLQTLLSPFYCLILKPTLKLFNQRITKEVFGALVASNYETGTKSSKVEEDQQDQQHSDKDEDNEDEDEDNKTYALRYAKFFKDIADNLLQLASAPDIPDPSRATLYGIRKVILKAQEECL